MGSRWAGARSSRAATTGDGPEQSRPWEGRDEDKFDDRVWAATCFFIRRGFRKGGVSRELARAAAGFARDRGARAIEGYPITTTNVIMEELQTITVLWYTINATPETQIAERRRNAPWYTTKTDPSTTDMLS
jgi:hypothetical protein